eukprot:12192025-Prorocentrum_lima.AAC.1
MKEGGHALIIKALESLDKVVVVQEQQKFDIFFKQSRRKRGTEPKEYVREFERRYNDLRQMDEGTQLGAD